MSSRWSFSILAFLLVLTVWAGTACSRLDDIGRPDGEQSRSLALSLKNVLPGQDASTKMSTQVTQFEGNFRGIERMFLIPFNTESARAVEQGDSRLGNQNIVLGSSGISQSGLVDNNNSHLFGSAFVPSRMNRVLAYGKAPDYGGLDSKDRRHINGVLTAEGLADPSGSDDISFHLEPILASGEIDEYADILAMADALLDKLNVVMAKMAESKNASILTIFDNAKRLNNILACSYPTFDQMRNDILTALLRIPYESMDLVNEIGQITATVSEFSAVLSAAGGDFPSSYGIPEGAIGFWWNGKSFVRLINGVNIALVDPVTYCYPPCLWYYANSPVKTSINENVEDLYVPSKPWNDIISQYKEGNVVTTITQAVAVEDPLQYGVGLLQLSLKTPGEEAATLVPDCPLTGIIIGDQNDVDFSFMPASGASRYIFDNNTLTEDGYLKIGETGLSVPMLVLQTPVDKPVHFALEFKNNTGIIRKCQQGDILPRCKFYLAGTLKPTTGRSVFEQDCKTTISVKIDGLRNAYNTVPDLHDPQLEVGIETEMKWTQITPQSIVLHF